MSQHASASELTLEKLLNSCRELGRIYHAASSAEVANWTSEHVNSAFGWAEWVESVMTENVEADLEEDIDADLTNVQSEPGMVSRTQLVLTTQLLRGARGLLLRLLLQNHACTAAIARAVLTRHSSGGADTPTALMPACWRHSQYQLLKMMRLATAPRGGSAEVVEEESSSAAHRISSACTIQ